MAQQECLGSIDKNLAASPMPAIGVYIAASTLVCLLFLVIDVWQGYRRSKHILPSRFFSLNSLTLTLLGISMKLPVDLTSSMPGGVDQISKLCGPVLMTMAMGFFAPSVGDMEGFELLGNMAALTILVVTVIVNLSTQMSTGVIFSIYFPEHVLTLSLMLLTLTAVWYLAYVRNWITGLVGDCRRERMPIFGDNNNITTDEVKRLCQNAFTNSPQFAICFCTNHVVYVGFLCIISFGALLEACIRTYYLKHLPFCKGESEYKWSMWIVVVSQFLTVVVGTSAITYRSVYNSLLFLSDTSDTSALTGRDVYDLLMIVAPKKRFVCFAAFKEIARSVSIQSIQYMPLDISMTSLVKLIQALEELVADFFFGVYIGMGWIDYAVKISLLNTAKGISFITRNTLDMKSLPKSLWLKVTEDTETFLRECEKDEPRSLIQFLKNTRPSPYSGLNEESNSCLLAVLLVRVASIMVPLGQSLADALDEIFEILYFIDQQQSTTSGFHQNLNKRVAKELWMSRGLSDHWFEKNFLGPLQKDSYGSVNFCLLLSEYKLDRGTATGKLTEIVSLWQWGVDDEEISGFLRLLYIDIMYFLLPKFPKIISQYITQCPVAEMEKRSRTALKFLCKYQMLVPHVEWLSVG